MGEPRNIKNTAFKIETSLALPDDEVQLWRLDLESLRADEARWKEVLSPDETSRASRFHFAVDRRRFVVARAISRVLVMGCLKPDRKCLTVGGWKRGRPGTSPGCAD